MPIRNPARKKQAEQKPRAINAGSADIPRIFSHETLSGANSWEEALFVGFEVINEFESGGVIYSPVFRLDVQTPKTQARFFRAHAVAQQGEVSPLLGVRNGLMIDGRPGINLDIIHGAENIVFKGGARVQPQAGGVP